MIKFTELETLVNEARVAAGEDTPAGRVLADALDNYNVELIEATPGQPALRFVHETGRGYWITWWPENYDVDVKGETVTRVKDHLVEGTLETTHHNRFPSKER